MKIAITVIALVMGLYCLIVRIPKDRVAGIRLLCFWVAVGASAWSETSWLIPLAALLLFWPLLRKLFGLIGAADPVKSIDIALSADFYRDREGGIQRAAELATPEAWDVLTTYLAKVDAKEDEEELLAIFQALISGWGLEQVVERWGELPAQARMDFLEFAQGNTIFARESVLALARRGMRDDIAQLERRAWRTYAYTVTWAVESQKPDFDFAAWYAATAEDEHVELQALRRSLEERRTAEAKNMGLDSMVARYRREVFKVIPPRKVRLHASREYGVRSKGTGESLLPTGTYAGTLTGLFDNAQDAVKNGWQLKIELDESVGGVNSIECAWQACHFFGEVLSARHNPRRSWLEDAADDVVRALSLRPVVGPAVAWTDDLDETEAKIEGEALEFMGEQLLSCLVALIPGEGEVGDSLAILLYEANDPEEDELRPFVTVIALEAFLLGGADWQLAEPASE